MGVRKTVIPKIYNCGICQAELDKNEQRVEFHPFSAHFFIYPPALPLFLFASLRNGSLTSSANVFLHVLGLVQNPYQCHKFFLRQRVIINRKL